MHLWGYLVDFLNHIISFFLEKLSILVNSSVHMELNILKQPDLGALRVVCGHCEAGFCLA